MQRCKSNGSSLSLTCPGKCMSLGLSACLNTVTELGLKGSGLSRVFYLLLLCTDTIYIKSKYYPEVLFLYQC